MANLEDQLSEIRQPVSMEAASFTKQEAQAQAFQPEPTFEELQSQVEQPDVGFFEGTGEASSASLATSSLGMAYRAYERPVDDIVWDVFRPSFANMYEFSDEDIEEIRQSGLPASSFGALEGASSPENLRELIKLTKENLEYEKKIQQAGLGGQIIGGVVGAAGDPLSYVPMANSLKGMSLLNKTLVRGVEGAAVGLASEKLRSGTTGIEADYSMAAITGAAFSSGLGLLGDGLESLRNTGVRLEARESSRNANTNVDSSQAIELAAPEGTRYVPHPEEEGAVVTRDGTIISESNPVNPQTIEQFAQVDPERSAKGVKLGGFTELGLTIMDSDNATVRQIGEGLVRSPVGTQSGGRGKAGATASDIKERLDSTDHVSYNAIIKGMEDVLNDPANMNLKGSREDMEALVYRKIVHAIEDQTGESLQFLSEAEKKLMQTVKQHFDKKGEYLKDPRLFGNDKAQPILKSSRHEGTYVPQVYDNAAKANAIVRFGGKDGLKEAIKKSWMTSFESRPTVKARFQEFFKDGLQGIEMDKVDAKLKELVEDYAEKKANGISNSNKLSYSSVLEESLDWKEGIENNKFLEARNLFDSDMNVLMPDGQTFSVNDLRSYDMGHIMQSYDRRVNGDIAIMGATGKSTKDLKDGIVALEESIGADGKGKRDVEALIDTIKILTGRARRSPDSAFDHIARSLTDISFTTKNAYMGAMNITEIAGMVAKGNVKALTRGVPLLGEWITKRATKMPKEELQELHGALFGQEVFDLMRPSYGRFKERIQETTPLGETSAKALAGLRYATQEAAARNPFTTFMNASTNYMVDSARMGTIADVANHTLFGSKTMFDERMLKSSSVTAEQFENVKQLIRDYATVDSNGYIKINNKSAFASDPRAMDLWRLGDKMADEAILRPTKVSMQNTKAYGSLVQLGMQFKSFTIKSLNGRTIRALYEATKNGRAIDQTIAATLSMGLAAGFYAIRAQVAAQGIPEAQRQEYLDNALNPKMVAYAAVSRSSLVGAPLGLFNMFAAPLGFDPAKQVRTSILPTPPVEREQGAMLYAPRPGELFGGFLEQVPALGLISSGYQAGSNAIGLMGATGYDEIQYRTGLYNGLKGLIPNDPVSQAVLLGVFEEQGIMQRMK